MIQTTNTRNCLTCDKPLRGRSDKKFCDDYCRNSYNNRLNADSNNYVRKINNVLKKNRRILEELILPGEETARTNRENLLAIGFHFNYHTHNHTKEDGKTWFFCYEYGWMGLGGEWYLIMKRNEGN